ncbi:MAG TPA: DUF1552 domain-containing protein [Fimbriimonas sp.]|nr:DUF1552 domain-containing protein [Fimbriimonas sp.]
MNTIDRRTLLKGLGTVMALPMLERMLPTSAFAATAPKGPIIRNAYLFVPNGVEITHWTPAAEGTSFELPNILEPLADVKSSLNVLTGLTQHYAFANGDGPGDHARSCACWLTGVQARKTSGADIRNGVSVDQVAAQHIGHLTKFPSLELGCERGAIGGDCDSGYSCAYSSNISWADETTPVAKEVNPRLVFERLFGNGNPNESKESLARRQLLKQSILDFVSEDAAKLKGQLGMHDLRKMDEYFTAVREIEERLARFDNTAALAQQVGAVEPAGIPGDYGEHIRLMTDMMILAFQTDLTRTCTLMFANDGSNRTFAQIGVPEGHHDMSHHGGDPVKLAKKRAIDRFHVEQLAYCLKKMQSIKEPTGGTLLDNTMLVYGAGISDGNAHNHDNLPILMAGKAGGRIKTGRHVVYPDNTPLDNLYLDILDRMGVPTDHLGDSTGKLQGIF